MRKLPIAVTGVLAFLSVHLSLVACYCGTTYFSAVTSRRTVSTTDLSGKANCEWTINPTRSLRKDEYLEIKWVAFTALSFMPKCDGDYVEVFITTSRYSVGKYCTGGLHGLPFRISSPDGYAKIKFSLSISTGAHLELQYRIKQARHYLECEKDFIGPSSYFGVVASAGWPVRATSRRCSYRIKTQIGMVTKIVIMDFDLVSPMFVCHSRADYVQIKAWNGTEWGRRKVTVMKRKCGSRNPFSIETQFTDLQIDVNINSHRSFRRGFKAGILKYSVGFKDSKFPLTAVAVGGTVGGIALILLIAGVVCCVSKSRKRTSAMSRNGSTTAATPMVPPSQNTVQQGTQPRQMAMDPPPYTWKADPPVVYCPPRNDPPPPYSAVCFDPGYAVPSNAYDGNSVDPVGHVQMLRYTEPQVVQQTD